MLGNSLSVYLDMLYRYGLIALHDILVMGDKGVLVGDWSDVLLGFLLALLDCFAEVVDKIFGLSDGSVVHLEGI